MIDASAGPAGISGSVNISSPIQVLSGTLVPMRLAYTQTGYPATAVPPIRKISLVALCKPAVMGRLKLQAALRLVHLASWTRFRLLPWTPIGQLRRRPV